MLQKIVSIMQACPHVRLNHLGSYFCPLLINTAWNSFFMRKGEIKKALKRGSE
jgi:hypothetical protein